MSVRLSVCTREFSAPHRPIYMIFTLLGLEFYVVVHLIFCFFKKQKSWHSRESNSGRVGCRQACSRLRQSWKGGNSVYVGKLAIELGAFQRKTTLHYYWQSTIYKRACPSVRSRIFREWVFRTNFLYSGVFGIRDSESEVRIILACNAAEVRRVACPNWLCRSSAPRLPILTFYSSFDRELKIRRHVFEGFSKYATGACAQSPKVGAVRPSRSVRLLTEIFARLRNIFRKTLKHVSPNFSSVGIQCWLDGCWTYWKLGTPTTGMGRVKIRIL